MKFQWFLGIVIALFVNLNLTFVFASRIRLRPLTGKEVYRILKDAGREDVIPEGRIVSQGIAAASGFALGIKSGIAVPLAIGLATSNATQDFLNSINYTAIANSFPTIPPITLPTINISAITSNIPTINLTALTGLFKPESSNTAATQYTTQEICFSSRSLNDINDNDNDDYYDDDAVGRQAANDMIVTSSGSGTGDGIDSITSSNDNEDSGTDSETYTSTGNDGAINCVVIQKPVTG